MKKYIAALLLLNLCSPWINAERTVETLSSYAQKNRYDFSLTDTALQASASWLKGREFPPLSPRKAIDTAAKVMAKLGAGDFKEWRFQNIALLESSIPDKWFYLVEYRHSFPPCPPNVADCTQGMETIRIMVLMNNTAIEPQVSEWPKK